MDGMDAAKHDEGSANGSEEVPRTDEESVLSDAETQELLNGSESANRTKKFSRKRSLSFPAKLSDVAASEPTLAIAPKLTAQRPRDVAHRKSNWHKIDELGNLETICVDKYHLASTLNVPYRDMRVLDPLIPSETPSSIFIRENALVLNLEHIKAVVLADRCYILASDAVKLFVHEVLERLSLKAAHGEDTVEKKDMKYALSLDAKDLPFELRVLEAALAEICRAMEREVAGLVEEAIPALDKLASRVSRDKLEKVHWIKIKLNRLVYRVGNIREELKKLLDDDDDMRDMLIGQQSSTNDGSEPDPAISGTGRYSTSTNSLLEEAMDDVESLLEIYFMLSDNSHKRLRNLEQKIDDTEDLINIDLNSKRNELFGLEVILTSFTAVFGFVAMIGAIFGMNLENRWEDSHVAFMWVTIGSCLVGFLIIMLVMWYLRRRRVLFVSLPRADMEDNSSPDPHAYLRGLRSL
uniref:Magnesium transporter n=1 Tax=Picocystis salinarum TaxID=88271 RepID=A0A7S3XEP0_9CHLO